MYRVYCNKKDGIVEQIFDITNDRELAENLNDFSFGGFFMIDTEEEIGYNYLYSRTNRRFELNPNYVEVQSTIIPYGYEQQNELENLKEENRLLRNELEIIKKHLGIS